MKSFSKKHLFFLLFFGLILASCTYLIKKIDHSNESEIIGEKDDSLSLVFSHNINGETHPCGCRKFPLGGLPQIAGKMEEIKQKRPMLYVDTGDTFFPSTSVPAHVESSQTFAARNLSKGLERLGLKYHVPGDQDLAKKMPFYRQLINEREYRVLAANLKKLKRYNGKAWVKYQRGPNRLYLVGLVSPNILPENTRRFFSPPIESFEKTYEEIQKSGFKKNDPRHRLIVLSSAGIDFDHQLAEKFGQIDWIIGGHSQSFLRVPRVVNGVKLVQVLSRNHYLGEIIFDLAKNDSEPNDRYKIHEIHDALAKKLDPNPFREFIKDHKERMSRLQENEQRQMSGMNTTKERLPTARKCLECHEAQADKWMKTPHSLAYLTLIRTNEANNLTCVKCHSVGLGKQRGFGRVQDMVVFEKQQKTQAQDMETKKLQKLRTNYWKDVRSELSDIESVRALGPEETKSHAKAWLNLDEKHGVKHNFANVQCLNCHETSTDHPFEMNKKERTASERFELMKTKCLSCHDPDQSPAWYEKNKKGLRTKLNESRLIEKMKQVGCPKLEH